MDLVKAEAVDSNEKSLVILQSLLCLLREKNILTRADIEELKEKVADRAAHDPFACRSDGVAAAVCEMQGLGDYLGRRYGGRHRRIS
ncbi:hypothetical protein [Sphingomonas sp.]|uniref:hypothetical protein n=1 Tax=Sphingomonas sp. TaxID=28214 RepID=UPI0035BBFDB5